VRGIPIAAVAAVVFSASSAAAVEREQQVGADLGGSLIDASGKTAVGGAVGAHWTYGVTDAFNILVEGSWSLVALRVGDDPSHSRPAWIANGDAGVGYVFDVLRWVPFVAVLAGGYVLSGGSIERARVLPGFEFEAGLDYRFNRSLKVGAVAREHMLFTDLSTYPTFIQVLARAECTWGW
jgi:hypothetical protein